MRLVFLGLFIIWTAVAIVGFFAWQRASDEAIQAGTPPPLIEVFPMVLLPGIFAAFSLVSGLGMKKKVDKGAPPSS